MTGDTLLPELQAASVQSRIALGERKGKPVRRLGALELQDFKLAAELKGPLCATTAAFSLHAAVYCAAWERGKLEKLCRYIARPAVAEERLELKASGDIVLKLKTKYSDGTSHLLFSGLEFVKRERVYVRRETRGPRSPAQDSTHALLRLPRSPLQNPLRDRSQKRARDGFNARHPGRRRA